MKNTQSLLKNANKKLEKFFGEPLKKYPELILMKSRKDINIYWGRKTEDWMTGWAKNEKIYILDPAVYTKESSHKNIRHFQPVLTHECAHLYYAQIAKTDLPKWLNEGLACYLAGQKNPTPSLTEALSIFKYFKKNDKYIYKPAYFWVRFLIKKFGKKKLLMLINGFEEDITSKKFGHTFYEIYKFKFSKESFKKLFLSS